VGERVLLFYPSGLEFIAAFFGCLSAGAVAVPSVLPPRHRPDLRLQAMIKDAEPKLLLTTEAILAGAEQRYNQTPGLAALPWLATDTLPDDGTDVWQGPALEPDRLAFLQYTSGSTGDPKGVMVSHANLWHNSRLINTCFEDTRHSRGLFWLPLYHDMGLIGGVLQPLFVGAPSILMPPAAFLQKPARWLQAISDFQVTTSGGPDFAYDLCVQKITPEQTEQLDLSCWSMAFSGAEPVRAETIERFVAAFGPQGFRREAFYPCYGLAEATLLVSGGKKGSPPRLQKVVRQALEQNQVALAPDEHADGRILVSCGRSRLDQQLVIVDPESLSRCPARQIGEIWLAGPSVAQGYWNRVEETKQIFQAYLADSNEGPFLRTGDLGYIDDGELFITGRLKDVIIIRGRNHYPQDIELTVEQSHPALRPGFGAAFSVEMENEERLVIVHEVERTFLRKLDINEVIGNIRHAVAKQHQLQTYDILLLKPGTIPKTSSGKTQRYACRQGYLTGNLNVIEMNHRPIEII
jgi:acyl-CoA synthetase (AMP-forming)/AMP-acid ligase II